MCTNIYVSLYEYVYLFVQIQASNVRVYVSNPRTWCTHELFHNSFTLIHAFIQICTQIRTHLTDTETCQEVMCGAYTHMCCVHIHIHTHILCIHMCHVFTNNQWYVFAHTHHTHFSSSYITPLQKIRINAMETEWCLLCARTTRMMHVCTPHVYVTCTQVSW